MKNLGLSLLLLLTLGACHNDAGKQSDAASDEAAAVIEQNDVYLLCQEVKKGDEEDADFPLSEVFLQLAESKVKLADLTICQTINPEQYNRHQIPPTAISAVGGWYAGAGDYLYVVEEEGQYVVRKGAIFEESEDGDYHYEVIAKFSKSLKDAL